VNVTGVSGATVSFVMTSITAGAIFDTGVQFPDPGPYVFFGSRHSRILFLLPLCFPRSFILPVRLVCLLVSSLEARIKCVFPACPEILEAAIRAVRSAVLPLSTDQISTYIRWAGVLLGWCWISQLLQLYSDDSSSCTHMSLFQDSWFPGRTSARSLAQYWADWSNPAWTQVSANPYGFRLLHCFSVPLRNLVSPVASAANRSRRHSGSFCAGLTMAAWASMSSSDLLLLVCSVCSNAHELSHQLWLQRSNAQV
jgi:hypothetical protein